MMKGWLGEFIEQAATAASLGFLTWCMMDWGRIFAALVKHFGG